MLAPFRVLVRAALPAALLAAALLAGTFVPASAAGLDGAYGNKDGCRYAKTGESSGADDFVLLTKEALTTSTAVCTFAAPPAATADGYSAKASCEAEGESDDAPAPVVIAKGPKGLTVRFSDGASWGPLPKCR